MIVYKNLAPEDWKRLNRQAFNFGVAIGFNIGFFAAVCILLLVVFFTV